MKLGIKTIDTLSLVDKVELRLMEYISRDDVIPGDLMPKELELTETFGVSRTVIREALSRIRMLGLIRSRKHKGMEITKPDVMSNLERILKPQIIDIQTLKDVFELRIVLEIGMAELLFARKTDADIKALETIVNEEGDKNGLGIFEIEEELKFHGKLYEISGNATLKRFQEILLPVFKFVKESQIFKPIENPKPPVTHKDLLKVIKTGTPNKFERAMKKHLRPQLNRLLHNDKSKKSI